MPWNPTNANDVELTVSEVERTDDGSRSGSATIGDTANIVVDDFSIETDEDLEGLSGVGNSAPQGVTRGDIDYSFSFTVQGEDAELFTSLASDDGRANELEIVVKLEDYKDKLTGAYAGTRELSGTSGDAVEFAVEGIATGRSPGQLQ